MSKENSKHEYICQGCDRMTDEYECKVYAYVPSYYIRQGCCYFNRPKVVAKKVVTKGQTKHGRNR